MTAGDGRPIIVWFRRDLRLADNPALQAAIASRRPILPVFVRDESPQARAPGGAGAWWLERSLAALAADLESRGSRLILRRGPAAKVIAGLAAETVASAVCWNNLPEASGPDAALARTLACEGAEAQAFDGAYLLAPGAVRTKAGGRFSVFTPFWRQARTQVEVGDHLPAPRDLPAPAAWPASERLDALELYRGRPDWACSFDQRPGEAAARATLRRFVETALADYGRGRDLPAVAGSSRLAPHLHWGEISPQDVWRSIWRAVEEGGASDAQAEKFVSELGWREFNAETLRGKPDLARANYDPAFDAFPWRADPAGLRAWTRGLTGYPIVDAGMRQLWSTGFMHNRVRMIAASFLTKHLLVDWREGEAWFWDTLTDADHANNAANWQWVAGSGADAAPYFRIFNPVLQGARFDAAGDYVRAHVPELANLPARFIHAPWSAPAAVLAAAGVKLGETYPRPIVDHPVARARALEAYRVMRAARPPS